MKDTFGREIQVGPQAKHPQIKGYAEAVKACVSWLLDAEKAGRQEFFCVRLESDGTIRSKSMSKEAWDGLLLQEQNRWSAPVATFDINYSTARATAIYKLADWLKGARPEFLAQGKKFRFWRNDNRGSYGITARISHEISSWEEIPYEDRRRLLGARLGEFVNLLAWNSAGDGWGYLRVA